MTGWEKVGALTALYVIGMLWVNWTMVRRARVAIAARVAWTAADFDAAFDDVDPRVPPAIRSALSDWYGAGVVPQPEDMLRRFLKMDNGDVDDVVGAACARLAVTPPAVLVADLPDVAALVRYVDRLAKDGGAPSGDRE